MNSAQSVTVPPPDEGEIASLAREISALGARSKAGIYHLSWWSDKVLRWAMSHEEFKTQLFRFVDTLPALGDDEELIADYLDQYFSGVDMPRLVDWGLSLAERVPGGSHLSSTISRRNVERMARQFIAGETAEDAAARSAELWAMGISTTMDLLGEHTVSDAEADAYGKRAAHLLGRLTQASAARPTVDDPVLGGRFPRVSLSVKVSALTPSFTPLSIGRATDDAMRRLEPIIAAAGECPATIYLDMESFETKDIIHSVLERLSGNPRCSSVRLGVVIQAYLKDAHRDLERVVDLSRSRTVPLSIRLVKGAYWDTESVISSAQGWPMVAFETKEETDASFDKCARYLLAHHEVTACAFATHNLRSIAYVLASARGAGLPEGTFEMQLLYGMAEPVQNALRELGTPLRLYCPIGALVPGMSYLVRRLLENTSNESFVRHRFAEGQRLEELLRSPGAVELPGLPEPVTSPATDPRRPSGFRPEPAAEWRRSTLRRSMERAVDEAPNRFGRFVPVMIDGRSAESGSVTDSRDPAQPSTVLCEVAQATTELVHEAVATACAAGRRWARRSPSDRAGVLFRAAQWMRTRRLELAALEVYEVGKPWADADADVCEAIDYCEYYGREALRLAGEGRVDSPPGEENHLVYEPRGVAAVIAPWNFPLAIPTGMVTAALSVGNAVVFKPAEQSPACGYALVEALLAAGLPPETISFVPGAGEVVGAALVAHPEIDIIAFTGSREVGLGINEIAAHHRPGKRSVTRVIAEMGGKNAVVVDSDADLDEAVLAITRSAFGYAGQKCSAASRVIVVGSLYDRLAERLVGAASALTIGHPRDMEVQMGPLIDESAVQRVRRYKADPGGVVLLDRNDAPRGGYFEGPMIVGDVDPDSPLAQDEIFGPVLALLRARDFDEALSLANRTDYGLTAGVISRSPVHVAQAVRTLRAGNVYINRAITGAVVGRQPFGGSGLSGVGSKAGGPDYLLQFTNPKVITENTMRHGFAPSPGGGRAG